MNVFLKTSNLSKGKGWTNKRILAFGMVLFTFFYFGLFMQLYAAMPVKVTSAAEFSDKLIRLHVVANSDSPEDQALKLMVRDRILTLLQPQLEQVKTLNEAREILQANLSNIEKDGEAILRAQGDTHQIVACIEHRVFPEKNYGPVTLPPGDYEALDVKIGAAEGKNWWCIMFPPLCFTDAVTTEDNEKLQEMYDQALQGEKHTSHVKIKFKIAEVFDSKENQKNAFSKSFQNQWSKLPYQKFDLLKIK